VLKSKKLFDINKKQREHACLSRKAKAIRFLSERPHTRFLSEIKITGDEIGLLLVLAVAGIERQSEHACVRMRSPARGSVLHASGDRSENFLVFGFVALSFLFDKYYVIME
jgi:hypothetical protein